MKTTKTIMTMAFSAMCCASLFATTRYVVPSESGYDALTPRYTSIAAALDAAAANDTILVCKGTYSITASYTLSRTQHAGVMIRSYDPDNGGKINRDETILDGEGISSGDGIFNCTGNGGEVGIVFDGLTFRKSPVGALRFISTAGMKILNCNFYTNTVDTTTASEVNVQGGAIRGVRCDGTLVSNCVFVANKTTAANGNGGAIYHSSRTDGEFTGGTVVDCVFKDNQSVQANGGAIFAGKKIAIRKCDFDGNKIAGSANGGSVYIVASSIISECTFTGLVDGNFAVIAVVGPESGYEGNLNTISNCTFKNVTLGTLRRALVTATRSELLAENCIFRNVTNVRAYICATANNTMPITYRNCLFDCPNSEKVIHMDSTSTGVVTFENCTVYSPGKSVVSFSASGSSSVEWKNCILNCTTPATNGEHVQTVTDCYTGTDPLFVCADEGVFRLRSDSPCIDQSAALPWHDGAVDLAGNPRVVGAKADYGCYERQQGDKDFVGTMRLVATAEEKTGDWADAYTDFQTAIDATPDRYCLLVKPGLYRPAETIVISNRFIEVVSCGEDGEPDPVNTVIDGQNARRVMLVHWGETSSAENSDQNPVNWRPVRLEGLTFKDGLALTNGATATQPFAGDGGGLLLYGRAPSSGYAPSRVVNCRFDGCSAVNGGGAALFGGWLEDCKFTSCTATYGGGACGIEPNVPASRTIDWSNERSWYSATLMSCSFVENIAHSRGGGYSCSNDSNGRHAYIESCNFVSNKTDGASSWSCHGSGLSNVTGSLITNCTFTCNTGAAYGALNIATAAYGVDLVLYGNVSGTGAISVQSPSTVLERCKVMEDPANPSIGIWGGATCRNCLVVNKSSSRGCIRQYGPNYPLVIENCTLVNKNGIVIDVDGRAGAAAWTLVLKNSIIWRVGEGIFPTGKTEYPATYATNCCFSCTPDPACGFKVGVGCFINTKPGFVDAENGNWSLRGSTCRDKGMMLDWMTADSIDFAGNPRVVSNGKTLAQDPSALPDLGCYELQDVPPGMTIILR